MAITIQNNSNYLKVEEECYSQTTQVQTKKTNQTTINKKNLHQHQNKQIWVASVVEWEHKLLQMVIQKYFVHQSVRSKSISAENRTVLPLNTNCKWSYYRAREVIMIALFLSHQAACKTCHVYDCKHCMAIRTVHHACCSGGDTCWLFICQFVRRYAV